MDFKPGQLVKVTISKRIQRDAARKTLERLFMNDKAVVGPIAARTANHEAKPKRRGGRIWTKYPNKVHAAMDKGAAATLKVTAQLLRDLKSVEDCVQVSAA